MTWKYFKENEVKGIVPALVKKLDTIVRPVYGPLVITSGARTADGNDAAGGVRDSAHLDGLAVDLRCTGWENQLKLAWLLGLAGFERLGIYDKHIHGDLDSGKPHPVMWFGGKSK